MLRAPAVCAVALFTVVVPRFSAIAAPQDTTPEVVIDSQLNGSNLPAYTLALTYDDGPDADTEELARYLNAQGIKATFFINGCRIQGSPTTPNLGESNCLSQEERYPASTLQTLMGAALFRSL